MIYIFYTDFILRIFLSLVLGFLIGSERQLTDRPVGIHINVLVCMRTNFFTLSPMLYGLDQIFRAENSIISDVGFLCSGVIFKDNRTVCGISTAATLWCTVAIGILASTGMYAMAITTTGILIASSSVLCPLARGMDPTTVGDEFEKQYRVSVTYREAVEQEIRLLPINSNSCKTLFLNSLESGDVVSDKIEIIAKYCSIGKPKDNVLEETVRQALAILEVIGADWEVL